jgi:sugar phosphate permease
LLVSTGDDALPSSRLLRILLAFAILVPLADRILNVLISVYAFLVFDMGNTGTGILYGALGTGLMLGGALTQRLSKNLRKTIAAALFAEGFCQMPASQSTAFPIAAFLFVLVATAAGIGNACTDTLIMRTVPSDRLGRVLGFLSSLQNGMFGAAMLGAGSLLQWVPPRTLGLAGGAFFAAVALIAGTMLVRSRSMEEKERAQESSAVKNWKEPGVS